MDKLKRFIDIFVPTETCNLRCSYCYITQNRKFNGKLFEFDHTIDDIKKSFSQERLGGICLINFCAGGETLLTPIVIDIIRALLECGHYLMIVTNGTLADRFEEMSNFKEDLKKRLFIKFSFHYLELKRTNQLTTFINNAKLMKESGISFTIELAADDNYIPYQEEIIELCEKEFGAMPHITILRDDRKEGLDLLSKYNMEELSEKWAKFDSELFNFRKKIWQVRRTEFCYAGDWSFCVNLKSGEITKCFGDKIIGNIYDYDKKIKFECVGCNCKYPYCYAGHAFLALGVIPEINIGTFDELRDRPVAGWLSNEMKSIMSQKLEDNNEKYGPLKKYITNKKIKKEKKINLKNYNYNLIKKLKNDKTQFVDIIEARQELLNIFTNIPQKYNWIFNYSKERNQKTFDNKIIIKIQNDKNELSQGYEICIVGILTKDNWYYANELSENNWIDRNNCLVWRNYDVEKPLPLQLELSVPADEKITLIFEKNKWRGKCELLWDNKSKKIDCYSEEDDELLFINLNK